MLRYVNSISYGQCFQFFNKLNTKLVKHDFCKDCNVLFSPQENQCSKCNKDRFYTDNKGRNQMKHYITRIPLSTITADVFSIKNIQTMLQYISSRPVSETIKDVIDGTEFDIINNKTGGLLKVW